MEKNYSKVDTRIDFIKQEHEILDWWEDQNIFQKLMRKNANNPVWSFLDGPITANNPMGVHHAWGRTYKDIFQRYHAMQGYAQRYQNGFDCQGLWVEVEVERELGFKSKRDIEAYGIEKFVNQCKARVQKYAAIQTEQSKRLGYWMDWDNSYFTMSDENNYAIWGFLKKIYEKGWLRKGDDSMPWCPRCGTGISQHEMAEGYKEIQDKSLYVLFPIDDRDNEYLVIWTTTPWTLSSNVAAAVSRDLEYLVIEDNGKQLYLLPESLPRIFGKKYKPNVLRKIKGSEMLGWTYRGPFDELPTVAGTRHVVIHWDEVSTTEGTGTVHIAPGCGKEDFDLGQELGLDMISPVTEDGKFLAGFGFLTGVAAHDVADSIILNLKEKGILLKQELYSHRYPHCWRCKTKLIYRVVNEWYISMDELRYQIMEVARQIKWMPGFGLDRELDWLRNMSDWMISKKRYWGLALPIYECDDCGHVQVIGSRAELQQQAVSGWEEFEGNSPHRPWIDAVKIACPKCKSTVNRIPDVGNPWLDAGIVPFSTMQYNEDREYWSKWFPADFITESFPGQFRNWFYCLLAMSTVLENKPPFKQVLGYALVKDADGRDMHKSDGNAIWFDDAAEKMGVDVIRWMYADHNPEQNLLFGFDAADDVRKRLLTIWNSYSFFVTYAALDHFNPTNDLVPLEIRPDIDRWMTSKTHTLIQLAENAYNGFRTDHLMRGVNRYLEDLSNWYIRRNRRRFWKSGNDADKLAAYSTLYESLVTFAKIMAPVIPFISETIYRNLVCNFDDGAPESVHLTEFPVFDSNRVDQNLLTEIDAVIRIVNQGRSARNQAQLKIRQPLSEIVITGDKNFLLAATNYADLIREELNIKSVRTDLTPDRLIDYSISADMAQLGPAFGKQAGIIKAALESLPAAEVIARVEADLAVEIKLDGTITDIAPEMIIINQAAVDPYAVSGSKELLVAVNKTITAELRQEGIVRDLIRHVQTMRKEADFRVEDRILVGVLGDDSIKLALDRYKDYFLAEVLGIQLSGELEKPNLKKVVNLAGSDVHIHIGKV